ncbi:inorganic polyphosphate/ATP-NAD kinase [Alkalidesulfovibrio alkalitolerans DSM 16529]|uniref:NAD kinase n=1 Tax=Alkalidesulfovibrio alkalitolerans DSM 16529 TaxID=1121439 RepID=S7URL3_9BACT|nr:NAD(+)/NADH kinase [Alkalidesulfovibrio alkalitolerans]EPR34953.1 inorganic polyphosphate/ATP-NAD kinase [Alkalidesulfovibrio alkalitolerans DSM 16529]
MSPATRRIVLVVRDRPQAHDLAEEIASWCAGRGVVADRHVHDRSGFIFPPGALDGAELVLVLGGDGTFLSVARAALGSGVPLLGLNMGRVGFLTEMRPEFWPMALDTALNGAARVEERLAFVYHIERDGKTLHSGRAVNDLVVGRGRMARLVRLSLTYGGEHVSTLRADGLILSTPTGSTAYSVSAGGPLVHPGVDAFCVTPICPFRNYFKALVLPAEKPLSVVNEDHSCEVFLTEDGQDSLQLAPGDRLEVRRAPRGMTLLRLDRQGYFQTLVDKGFLTELPV